MNIKILIKKDKHKRYIKEAKAEYEKRLSRYCRLSFIDFKDSNEIMNILKDSTYLISIGIEGQTLPSEELAATFNRLAIGGTSEVAFVISNKGINNLEDRINYKIAISRMDIEEGLLEVLLLEQIYRGFKILNNEPYHK